MDANYQIIVPTRNSSAWIGTVAKAYRDLGVRPLYLYDTRSCDHTLSLLRQAAMDVVEVSPALDRVEGMLAIARDVASAEWVVRFDDDELPSRALLDWLAASLPRVAHPTVALSRRDALYAGGVLGYSRLEDYYFHPTDPTFLDPQWRAFRPRDVSFVTDIHTAGFDISRYDTAPSRAYFVHFDWIIRSFAQRLAKIENYERQSPGSGWRASHFYLQELHRREDVRWTPFETAEFDQLARLLRS